MTSGKQPPPPPVDPQDHSEDTAGPRGRALRHLHELLRKSAITGAALVLVACESSSGGAGGTTTGSGGGTGTGTGNTGGSGGTAGSGGSMVCDPMPQPLVCTGDPATSYFSQFVSWLAQWDDTGGPGAVRVDLNIYLYDTEGELSFAGDPTAVGATVGTVNRQPQTLSFYVTPSSITGSGGGGGAGGSSGGAGGSSGGSAGAGGAPAEGTVHLTVPLSCNSVSEQLRIRLDASGTPVNGGAVAVLVDE